MPYWAAEVVIVLAFNAAISASSAAILSSLVTWTGLWAAKIEKRMVSISKSEVKGSMQACAILGQLQMRETQESWNNVIDVRGVLTIAIGSKEAPIGSPAVGALELVTHIAAPVAILSNHGQFVLARGEHLSSLVCLLCHLHLVF